MSTTACNSTTETPDHAFDGSLATKACSNSGGNKWVYVRLPTSSRVSTIICSHAEAGGEDPSFTTRDFQLDVSSDGQTWTTVARVLGNPHPVTRHDIGTRRALYVRFLTTQAEQSGDNALRLYEMDVRGTRGLTMSQKVRAANAATGTSGTLTTTADGGAAAFSGTSTITGSLAAAGTGTAAFTGTSTVTGTLGPSGDGQASIVGAQPVTGDLTPSGGGGAAAFAGSPVVSGTLGATGGGQAAMTGSSTEVGSLGATGGGQAAFSGTSTITGDLAAAGAGGRASLLQTNGAVSYEDEWHPDGNLGDAVWRPDYYGEPLLP